MSGPGLRISIQSAEVPSPRQDPFWESKIPLSGVRHNVPPGVRHRTQRRPELDEFIFRLLVNKIPMRRICETAQIPASTRYSKIQYLADQALAFSAAMERPLPEAKPRFATRSTGTPK